MPGDTPDRGRRTALLATAAMLLASAAPRFGLAQGASDKIKIGMVGAGNIGGTIGGLWIKAGHPVLFSSRHPAELKGLTDALGPLASAGTVEEALAFGEVMMLAVPYGAIPQLSRDHAEKFSGKITLDACNAVAARDGEALVKETREKGIGRTTAGYFPGAHIVRAFNSIGARIFAREAHRAGDPLAVPIAGDDRRAIEVATQLVRDAGFEAVAVPLARAQEFAQGGPLYGQLLTATELRRRFGLAQ